MLPSGFGVVLPVCARGLLFANEQFPSGEAFLDPTLHTELPSVETKQRRERTYFVHRNWHRAQAEITFRLH